MYSLLGTVCFCSVLNKFTISKLRSLIKLFIIINLNVTRTFTLHIYISCLAKQVLAFLDIKVIHFCQVA